MIVVGRFKEVRHLVDDDVFEEVPWFLHQFGVEPDVAGAVLACAPLGFHALQEVSVQISSNGALQLVKLS